MNGPEVFITLKVKIGVRIVPKDQTISLVKCFNSGTMAPIFLLNLAKNQNYTNRNTRNYALAEIKIFWQEVGIATLS